MSHSVTSWAHRGCCCRDIWWREACRGKDSAGRDAGWVQRTGLGDRRSRVQISAARLIDAPLSRLVGPAGGPASRPLRPNGRLSKNWQVGEFPLQDYIGFDLVEEEPGRVVATMDVTERHLSPHGMVHGGVLFTLVDTAMGKATMGVLDEGQICASIEVSARYLRAVNSGRLVAEVTVIRPGRRVVHLEGKVWSEGDDRLIAVMTGSFAVIDP